MNLRFRISNRGSQSGVAASLCHRTPNRAFTILEVMLAIFIFAMVLTAIYATWIGILRGAKAADTATAEAQRSRIAVWAVEKALVGAQMLQGESSRYSTFIADTTGDYAYLSLVSRLPGNFPGIGRWGGGDVVVRRVTFEIQDGPGGKNELVVTHAPMLMATNEPGAEAHSIILAKDVTEFTLEFYDPMQNDWFDEWSHTNRIPAGVKVNLGLGKKPGSSEAHNVAMRMVSIPAGSIPQRSGK